LQKSKKQLVFIIFDGFYNFIKTAHFSDFWKIRKIGQKWGSKMGPKTRKTSKNSDFGVAIAHCF
jgi:hypothetical protein